MAKSFDNSGDLNRRGFLGAVVTGLSAASINPEQIMMRALAAAEASAPLVLTAAQQAQLWSGLIEMENAFSSVLHPSDEFSDDEMHAEILAHMVEGVPLDRRAVTEKFCQNATGTYRDLAKAYGAYSQDKIAQGVIGQCYKFTQLYARPSACLAACEEYFSQTSLEDVPEENREYYTHLKELFENLSQSEVPKVFIGKDSRQWFSFADAVWGAPLRVNDQESLGDLEHRKFQELSDEGLKVTADFYRGIGLDTEDQSEQFFIRSRVLNQLKETLMNERACRAIAVVCSEDLPSSVYEEIGAKFDGVVTQIEEQGVDNFLKSRVFVDALSGNLKAVNGELDLVEKPTSFMERYESARCRVLENKNKKIEQSVSWPFRGNDFY